WADAVGSATPTTLGVVFSAQPEGASSSLLHPTCPLVERAASAATTSVSQEKLPVDGSETLPPPPPPALEGSSSSSSSMRTRGVDDKPSGPREALPPLGMDVANGGGGGGGGASLAVVIDGETLALLEEHADKGILDRFLTLGTLCDAVICSRVSPSQKALIVHNMRVRCEGGDTHSSPRKGNKGLGCSWLLNPLRDLFIHDNDKYMVTLAIGDGGNDIAMIQEAHVGIGIAGQEGLQASRAADFSIGQFRFLQKLLLVHGRWSYVRVSMFIMGTFYKCMAFYVTQLIYQFYTGFSGTSLFESWTLSMYNTLFSILPVLVVGIFEQDLQPETLLAYPELYRDMGPRNHLFTVPLFLWRVVFIGIIHAVVAAFFPFAANLMLGFQASSNDLYITGFTVYSIMVVIVTLKIAYLDVRRWVVFSHLSVVLTLAVWFAWNGVLNHVYPRSPGSGYNVLSVFHMLMKKGAFWFEWIIFVAIALCLNMLVKTVYSVRDPVEHRIMTWVACERRMEAARHRGERRAWLSNLACKPMGCLGGLWAGRKGRRPRSHSD
ncbi:drs2 neo1 protein, partial [Coemansia furcata]